MKEAPTEAASYSKTRVLFQHRTRVVRGFGPALFPDC